ncbi:hypothetical protein EVAR_90299_1 [Eumeta japonica]|uniref:Uncharacterized protein n=1 Tax=Eumeta variegata TaxID=151549 RepID=A0A4C2ACN1_EUMVA|nr:hypothetical protein EVAR_90299_1 [Eumeta japonica]
MNDFRRRPDPISCRPFTVSVAVRHVCRRDVNVPINQVRTSIPHDSKEIDASQAERLGRSCLSIVPRSRSHARLRRNATMSHAFSCVQPAFIDLWASWLTPVARRCGKFRQHTGV